MAAPKGNQNAAKAKRWTDAINRALEARSRIDQKRNLDSLAEKLLERCEDGDLQALKELGDRLEGKPGQSVAVTGDDGGPIETETKIYFIPVGKDGSSSSQD